MLRIEIKSAVTGEQLIKPAAPSPVNPNPKQFTPFTKVSQSAYVHGMCDRNGAPEAYPVRISIDLGTKEQGFRAAYPVGQYEVAPASYFIGKFDDMQLGRLTLSPVAVPVRQAA